MASVAAWLVLALLSHSALLLRGLAHLSTIPFEKWTGSAAARERWLLPSTRSVRAAGTAVDWVWKI